MNKNGLMSSIRSKNLLSFLIVMFILCLASLSQASTVTWSGGGADNLASSPANWVGGIVPADDDDVVFNGTSSKDCTWDAYVIPGSLNVVAAGQDGNILFKTAPANAGSPGDAITWNLGISIGSSGNVGIGTGAPAGYKLKVDGDAYTTGSWLPSDTKFKQNITPVGTVRTEVDADTGETEKAVEYTQLIPVLIEAIKSQQAQIEALKTEVAQMKGR